jgi:hypothetical protein
MGRLKIEINDVNNIREVLQESYRLADEQIIQSQNEINKLSHASVLQEEPMEARAKYAKAINDYLSIKDKAISKKLEIAKVLTDIYQHNGDIKGAMDDGGATANMSFNFEDIRKIVDNSFEEKEKTKKIELNKK